MGSKSHNIRPCVTITLASLYSCLNEYTKKGILDRFEIKTYDGFARFFLPEPMYLVFRCSAACDAVLENPDKYRKTAETSSRSTLNRVFNNQAEKRYLEAAKILLQKNANTGEVYTFSNSRELRWTASRWDSILRNLPADDKETLYQKIKQLILGQIANERAGLRSDLIKQLEQSFADCLSSLTMIASTLCCWNDSDYYDQMKALMALLLPEDANPAVYNGDLEKTAKDRAVHSAASNLAYVRSLLSSDREIPDHETINRVIHMCESILATPYLEHPPILGETCFILYNMYTARAYEAGTETDSAGLPADQQSERLSHARAYDYLKKSQRYGYEPALKILLPLDDTLTYKSKVSQTTVTFCYYNSENQYTDNFKNTLPENHQLILIPCTNLDPAILETESQKYFLFLDDDAHRNFKDTILFLQRLQSIIAASKARIPENSGKFPIQENIKIFMRGDEEVYAHLIDTAISVMDDFIIPVHILDDNKRSAQYLLTRHPLFYPIRNISSRDADLNLTLDFIIIGDDACAEWLVREAFWLMSFSAAGISTKIHILAPNATALYGRICRKCPGMQKNHEKVLETVPGTEFAVISAIDIQLDSLQLEQELSRLLNAGGYHYLAITGPEDESNLSMAIRIREYLIRNLIETEAVKNHADPNALSSALNTMPPIAFLCKDPNISYLSKKLLVGSKNAGELWYNSYELIPFGSANDCYTLDNLGGGILEQLSLCAHLQYAQVTPYLQTQAEAQEQKLTLTQEQKQAPGQGHGLKASQDSTIAQHSKDAQTPRFTQVPSESRAGEMLIQKCNKKEASLDMSPLKVPAYRKSLMEYYRIQYNKESSFSAVLSLPYRLFNCLHMKNRIMPKAWDITDDDAWFSPAALEELARKSEHIEKYNNIYYLARCEHDRWIRYELSRSWLPATKAEMDLYTSLNGNQPQLYIAKLHPLINSFESMSEEEKAHDIDSLRMTSEILRRAWLKLRE